MMTEKLQVIWWTIIWLFYNAVLTTDWMRYHEAREKGMYCDNLDKGLLVDTYRFDPRRPPQQRPVPKWSEFIRTKREQKQEEG